MSNSEDDKLEGSREEIENQSAGFDTQTSEGDSASADDKQDTADSAGQEQTLTEGEDEHLGQVLQSAREIAGQLEVLVPSVLDTAEATNSAAEVSRRASSALDNGLDVLQERVNELVDAGAKGTVLSARILLGSVSALLVALGLFVFMSYQISDRVDKVDAMLSAVSKRVVQMNSALDSFEKMNYALNQLAIKQLQFANDQKLLVEAVTNAEAATKNLQSQVPEAAAQRVSRETDELVGQVKSLQVALVDQGSQVAKVSNSVSQLAVRLNTFAGRVNDMVKLNADVEALITLERDKYLELLRRQVELEERKQAEEDGQKPTRQPRPNIVVYPIITERQK